MTFIFEVCGTAPVTARFFGEGFNEYTDQFEKAKILNDKTICDVENEIAVLLGNCGRSANRPNANGGRETANAKTG